MLQVWNSLHQNIQLTEILFDSEDKELGQEALLSIKDQLDSTRHIQTTIVARIEHGTNSSTVKRKDLKTLKAQNLSGIELEKQSALIKYLGWCTGARKVNLSHSNLKREVLIELGQKLSSREFLIEELDLSAVQAIDDEVLIVFSQLCFAQNENGTSSSLSSLILDDNNITNVGFVMMLDWAAQNTLLRRVSLKNTRLEYTESNVSEH